MNRIPTSYDRGTRRNSSLAGKEAPSCLPTALSACVRSGEVMRGDDHAGIEVQAVRVGAVKPDSRVARLCATRNPATAAASPGSASNTPTRLYPSGRSVPLTRRANASRAASPRPQRAQRRIGEARVVRTRSPGAASFPTATAPARGDAPGRAPTRPVGGAPSAPTAARPSPWPAAAPAGRRSRAWRRS
jgi:hypothetical protein